MSLEQRDAGLEETLTLPSGRGVLARVAALVNGLLERGYTIDVDEEVAVACVEPDVTIHMIHLLSTNAGDVAAILLEGEHVH